VDTLISVTGGADEEKSVKESHPGKTDKEINKCNQTLNKQGVTDECISNQMSTLESSEEGQTSTGTDDPEPDEENLCYPSSPKLRKKDKIQDVRRSERLRTKPSISYKSYDLD
jgi:hypothetical protein